MKSGDGAGGEEEAVAHEPRRSAQLDDGTIFRPVERPPPPPPWKTLPLLARFYFGGAHESLHCGARFPVSESEARENRKTQDALRLGRPELPSGGFATSRRSSTRAAARAPADGWRPLLHPSTARIAFAPSSSAPPCPNTGR